MRINGPGRGSLAKSQGPESLKIDRLEPVKNVPASNTLEGLCGSKSSPYKASFAKKDSSLKINTTEKSQAKF